MGWKFLSKDKDNIPPMEALNECLGALGYKTVPHKNEVGEITHVIAVIDNPDLWHLFNDMIDRYRRDEKIKGLVSKHSGIGSNSAEFVKRPRSIKDIDDFINKYYSDDDQEDDNI